jgi:RNA polymerase sigma-70 factor (ECF subfamily)
MSFSSSQERTLHPPILWARRTPRVATGASPQERIATANDELLMVCLQSDDHEALAELFRRHSRLVFSIGYRVLEDAGEAEEIVQDVFLYLYQRAGQFDEARGSAKAWIVQVAHSRALDRRNFLQRRHFYLGTDVADFADTLAGESDVERSAMSKWNLVQLEVALRDLPNNQRRTLELFFFEGLELREIALQLDESLENVRHHYYRGLQKLRKNGVVQSLRGKESI